MLQLCLSAGLVIIISALSSVLEAALYSLPISYIEITSQSHRRIGKILMEMKKDIHRPITAILTMNTISTTAGATIVGLAAAKVFGDHDVIWFSALFTLAFLLFAEILPKTLGVSYCRELAIWIAYPIQWMVKLLTPFILIIQAITRLLPAKDDGLLVSAQEIQALARQSHRSGEISLQERRVITNILDLKDKNVRQIMTPITVTFMLDTNLTVAKAMQANEMLNMHSRIPVYEKNTDEVIGIILRKDLFSWAAQGAEEKTLREFMQPVHFVPETGRLTAVMLEFFEHRQHLFVVVDEYGSVTGVVSLEDIIEEIVGREIIDESDRATNMREFAKRKRLSFLTQSQLNR
ncbi:MAG: hemolysin family protein [Desulfurivibrionaceae bacterium]|jgi:CBS domain containing-hemolysin-like protein